MDGKRNRLRKIFFIFLIIFGLCSISFAKHLHKEKYYQNKWCKGHTGKTEVVMPDGTRCDCITDEYAIEFDFAPKWAEAIGQALYYALQTGKKPGIVLILEHEKDYKYWIRLNTVIKKCKLPIKTWIIKNT
ncbi:hypothetical protein SAMN04488516_1174 [Desulfonauticus submarinus]|uniref:Uncharacterized protein n=1 Tax=Desulfonauticus submarinus TaxID=206665 RepID=A0A1H0G8K0_9BACT|nr:hypothetical protein [Desulfonauticus submarinus]SDO03181.1 hypothetical protein SAMN04488516_1174 [Desulfonauticus submarinus]